MSHSSNPAGWNVGGETSSKDRDKFTQFIDESNPPEMGKTSDDVEMNTGFGAEFGPYDHAPRNHNDKNLSVSAVTVGPDIAFPGDSSQWNQNRNPMRDFSYPGPDAKSSFGSEYNFMVGELVDNSTNVFEADMIINWPYNDLEDDQAGEGICSRQEEAEGLYNTVGLGPEFEHPSSDLHFAAAEIIDASPQHHDASSKITTNQWNSILNASLPLQLRPRRSMRKSKPPTSRPQTQAKSHRCDLCTSSFGRAGDLRRHYRVHFPDRRTFHCHLEGCDRHGQKGFYRRDKYRDHQRQAHGLGSESELVLLEGV